MASSNRTRKGQIQFKHGLAKDVPKRMSVGEPGFAVDTQDLYIGQGSTKPPVNVTGTLKDQLKQLTEGLDNIGTKKFQTDLINIETLEKTGTLFIDTEGFKLVDLKGNILVRLGSDFNTLFESVTAKNINWKDLGLLKVIQGIPTEFYVASTATGDGTGRNKDNKADSIEDVAKYLRNRGCFLDNLVSIYVENGTYYNLDSPVFDGFLGSGKIVIDFAENVVGQYAITIKNNTIPVQIDGTRYNHLSDVGACINSPASLDNLFIVDNSYLKVSGIRSKRIDDKFSGNFASILNNGVISVSNCDIVQYENQYYGNKTFTIYDQNNIGNCTRRLEGSEGVMYYGGYRINPKNSSSLDSLSFVALHNYTSPSTSIGKNSMYLPSVSPGDNPDTGGGEPSDTVVVPPDYVRVILSKRANLTNLHTTLEGEGLYTSPMTDVMGQGYTVDVDGNKYKNHKGHGTIPTEVKDFLADAIEGTISIVLTLHRMNTNHGYAGEIPVPKIKRPSGEYYSEGKGVARDHNISIELPDDIVKAIKDGSMTEIELYSANKDDYALFDTASIRAVCTKIMPI